MMRFEINLNFFHTIRGEHNNKGGKLLLLFFQIKKKIVDVIFFIGKITKKENPLHRKLLHTKNGFSLQRSVYTVQSYFSSVLICIHSSFTV